jgi:hypothetical protein
VTLNTTHTGAGTYASDSWSFTGAANYNDIASTTITDIINKATATVVVAPYTVTYDGNSHTATVTSITGVNGETGATVGTVTLNTTHTSAGTYSSDSWSFTGAANYNNIASTTITDTINKASQATLTVTGPGNVTYGTTGTATATGGSGTGALSFSAGASTGCSVSGTTVSVSDASGSCSLTATKAADSNYNAETSAAFSVTLVKASQAALTVTGPGSVTYGTTGTATATGGSGTGALSFSAGASTGCSVSGTTVSVSDANGSCSLTATKAADNNYNAATSVAFPVTLVKASQATLTVTGPGSVTYGTTGTATATGGSGTGALSFSAGASTGCTVSGTTVSVSDASGSCSLTATKAADINYNAATSVAFPVTLTRVALVITASSASMIYGGAVPTITASYSGFVNGDSSANLTTPPTCTTTATGSSQPGSYPSSCSGAASGNYTISYVNGTVTVKLTAPEVSLSSTLLIFSNQSVGTSSSAQNVTLTNTGTALLLISSITARGDFSQTNTCGTTLGAGNNCVISVTFKPTATGTRAGTISIFDKAAGSPQTVALSGTGVDLTTGPHPPRPPVLPSRPGNSRPGRTGNPGPPLVAVPSSSSTFSSQLLETSSGTQTNTDNAPLTVSSPAASGDSSQPNTCGTPVSTGKDCANSAGLKPAAAETGTGARSISDNATGSPQTDELSGPGPAITVGPPSPAHPPSPADNSQPETSLNPNAPRVSLSASSFAFSAQTVGTRSRTQTLTLTNTGNAPLTISSLTASGDFSQTNTCGTTVGAGDNCAISVTFMPVSTGTRTGTLSISDNATGSLQTVPLSGTGLVSTVGPHPQP